MASAFKGGASTVYAGRQLLIHAIRVKLLPEFANRGFETDALPEPRIGPMDRRLLVEMRFGRFRRTGPRGIELVEIQLAPRAQAAFRLNIGVAPADGIDTFAGHVAAEDILVGWLREYYALYQCPLFRVWFSVRRWPWREVKATDYEGLVERVVGLMPEVELALREGTQGRHIRLVQIDHPNVIRSDPARRR